MRGRLIFVGVLVVLALAIWGARFATDDGLERGEIVSGREPVYPPSANPDLDSARSAGPSPTSTSERPTGKAGGTTPHGVATGRPFDGSFDESEEPSRELIRAAVESAMAEHFVDYRLSSDEVERVTDSLVSLREAQVALRELPMGEETAEERRLLVEQIGEATSQFRSVLEMDPAEFTASSQPSVGVDRFDPDEPVGAPEFIERRE